MSSSRVLKRFGEKKLSFILLSLTYLCVLKKMADEIDLHKYALLTRLSLRKLDFQAFSLSNFLLSQCFGRAKKALFPWPQFWSFF